MLFLLERTRYVSASHLPTPRAHLFDFMERAFVANIVKYDNEMYLLLLLAHEVGLLKVRGRRVLSLLVHRHEHRILRGISRIIFSYLSTKRRLEQSTAETT